MSVITREPPANSAYDRATTRAAEGLARWRWTVDELDRMVEAGVLNEGDRLELIGGEIVPMSPKGARHERVKAEVADWIYRQLSKDVRLVQETGWRPREDTYLEPDILVYPARFEPAYVPPDDVLLLVEVADTSLGYDRGIKAGLYADLGVSDYWIIDAKTLQTHVLRAPQRDSGVYGEVATLAGDANLKPLRLPGVAFSLRDLGLE